MGETAASDCHMNTHCIANRVLKENVCDENEQIEKMTRDASHFAILPFTANGNCGSSMNYEKKINCLKLLMTYFGGVVVRFFSSNFDVYLFFSRITSSHRITSTVDIDSTRCQLFLWSVYGTYKLWCRRAVAPWCAPSRQCGIYMRGGEFVVLESRLLISLLNISINIGFTAATESKSPN